MATRLEFTLRFELISGLHTTGDRAELWTDRALTLDWHEGKNPIVPATTIKGWLRENSEQVLRTIGQQVCDGSQPSSICGSCLVCRVFGHPKGKSPLIFFDGGFTEPLIDTRTNVSLSRRRRTAYEERLFTAEVAWGETLEVEGVGFFPNPQEAKEAAALLWLSAKAGFALGASRSRGLGWLRFKEFEFKCDGKVVGEEELQAMVNAWRGERDEK
ncbi:MAG: CRISPR-associated protein [Candidatus Thorarchaeota archaeon]|nr:MAG: CRISPR-associated protein [Candidatus Thorarchaeota archaeon]